MRKLFVLLFLFLPISVSALPVLIDNVPTYAAFESGCGPTSLASIFGYYDYSGYSDLFEASGDDLFNSENIKHEVNWSPSGDSIADFYKTDGNFSWSAYTDDAILSYTASRGYDFSVAGYRSSWIKESIFTSEINAGRPVQFLVDLNGDYISDHYVAVTGYEYLDDGTLMYAAYDGWNENESEDLFFHKFQTINSQQPWSILEMMTIEPNTAPVPEPSTIIMMILGLFFFKRAKLKH